MLYSVGVVSFCCVTCLCLFGWLVLCLLPLFSIPCIADLQTTHACKKYKDILQYYDPCGGVVSDSFYITMGFASFLIFSFSHFHIFTFVFHQPSPCKCSHNAHLCHCFRFDWVRCFPHQHVQGLPQGHEVLFPFLTTT